MKPGHMQLLLLRSWNLPARQCVTVAQTVLAVSEPTCWALCYSGAGCLSSTYLLSTAGQGCRVFEQCQLLLHQQVRGAELDTVLLLF